MTGPPRLRPKRKRVAVVVTLSSRPELTPDEQISLRHATRFLANYDRYVVTPHSIRARYPGFVTRTFPDTYFGSVAAHMRLSLWRGFYEAFRDYEYMLVYHPDALVFSDQLDEWCEKGYDYIGAPWLNCDDTPFVTKPRVGNSGFSLRRIEGFLSVLDSTTYWIDPEEYWREFCRSNPAHWRWLNFWRRYAKRLRAFNNVQNYIRWYLTQQDAKDDYFWSDDAVRYYPAFRIPPVEEALHFAFEAAPRLCYKLTQGRLPFGCHAWTTYDRAFWEPYLIT
jgi:hypothetical protein